MSRGGHRVYVGNYFGQTMEMSLRDIEGNANVFIRGWNNNGIRFSQRYAQGGVVCVMLVEEMNSMFCERLPLLRPHDRID